MKRALILAVLVCGCSAARYDRTDGPTLAMPARLGEGSEQDAGGVEPAPKPTAERAATEPYDSLPDPPALAERRQWEMVVVHDQGKVRVERTTLKVFPRPVPTARRMGRWAIELWIGRELIDRVRFDFPLLGAEEPAGPRRPLKEPPSLAAGATVERTVLVPDSTRATRAILVDRATSEVLELPWPPGGAPSPAPPPKKPADPPPAAP